MALQVLHVIWDLEMGGTEKQLHLLLPQLQLSVRNEVICLYGHGEIGQQLEAVGIPVHYLKVQRYLDPSAWWRLWRLIRARKPEIVVTYLIYADIAGRVIARLAGVPNVITSHRSSLFGPAWRHLVDRATRWLVSQYTTQTQATKKLLQRQLKVAPRRIEVIANAAAEHIAAPSSLRAQLGVAPDDIVITCVANLKPEKNLSLLVEIFDELSHTHTRLHLWLVGEGPERTHLQQKISVLPSRSRIHLLGLRHDVPAILSVTDIFVLPTLIEGMSNALLEAMSAGLPCVTTDIPVNRELLPHDERGLLFKPLDGAALHTQLTRLITDPRLRASLGKSAAAYVGQSHTVSIIAQQWVALFNSLKE